MELRETTYEDINHPDLRERAKNGSRVHDTRHYLAFDGVHEIGFVALDLFPFDYIWMYDVLVPRELRHKGYGARILTSVEELAKKMGYRRIRLDAVPFERDYPEQLLVKWYRKHGYATMGDSSHFMEKELCITQGAQRLG